MDFLLLIFSVFIFLVICSAVHELGHILVGLKSGFKFYLLIVGPFGLRRKEDDKVQFFIEKDPLLWGGVGATMPQREDIANFKKFGYVLLGGPIFSITIGTIFLPLGITINNIYLSLFGAMSLGMGVSCLIPARNGAFYTDGGRWLRMHKDAETREVELAIWNLNQYAIVHGNYKEASFDDIVALINDKDLRANYLGHYYAYNFYKDNDDSENMEMEKLELENLKGQVPKQVVKMFSIK
ncbi:site-2 protease family protein [Clostridium fungisolvens]|uniref:Peptidase M50 domain-containing protein n=1 Tax=Clostridium fungisolvens TaxID=1604897 RepID=A0A6V8SE56_9CLOT|nr:site-2 protease family protein [Clostridium fungisolvens]GFP75350.1 hypothetical protein bsdtw1_01424 [Clostridium fungisolvens]